MTILCVNLLLLPKPWTLSLGVLGEYRLTLPPTGDYGMLCA